MSKKVNKIIALAGNPNSGKSSVFNQLTGLRQKIGNFPGVTVEKKIGTVQLTEDKEITLLDLPGTYSLHPTSQDERVVLNILSNPKDIHYPDVIVYVADVTNLEKHFLLFTQILDLNIPTVLALNMMDLAETDGIKINTKKIEKQFGVPVLQISGRYGNNLDLLKEKVNDLINSSAPQKTPSVFHFSDIENKVLQSVQKHFPNQPPYQAMLTVHHHEQFSFLDDDTQNALEKVKAETGFKSLNLQIEETMQRFNYFTPILTSAIQKPPKNAKTLTDKIDSILVHKTFGPVIFFGLMLLVFQAIFAWSSYPMDWIDAGFGWLNEVVKTNLPDAWYTDLLTDGIIAGLGGVLIFIPQIAILFFLISILEEIGYMARAMFMFDNLMQKFGLNGRSIVALISGGACAIPAIMSTRTISNWKERLITILVTPFISCSARIPVYTILIGFVVPPTTWGIFNLQGLAFMGLYLLGIVAALASAWVFKKILKSNESSFLLLELPQYRPPIWKNILLNIKEKVGAFVWEAGRVIMIISIILWFLASFGPSEKMAQAEIDATTISTQRNLTETEADDLLASKKMEASYAGHIGKFIEPTIQPLGYDWQIGIALLTSFAAREVFVGTMATIYSIGSSEDELTIREKLAQAKNPVTGAPVYTLATSLSLLIFYVFAMQCMSTVAVVKKETGSWKWAIIQFLFMTGLAYLGAFIAYQLLK
jgi:ferrous iron transport protein B